MDRSTFDDHEHDINTPAIFEDTAGRIAAAGQNYKDSSNSKRRIKWEQREDINNEENYKQGEETVRSNERSKFDWAAQPPSNL